MSTWHTLSSHLMEHGKNGAHLLYSDLDFQTVFLQVVVGNHTFSLTKRWKYIKAYFLPKPLKSWLFPTSEWFLKMCTLNIWKFHRYLESRFYSNWFEQETSLRNLPYETWVLRIEILNLFKMVYRLLEYV